MDESFDLLPIDYDNKLHVKSIRILSKINNFMKEEILIDLINKTSNIGLLLTYKNHVNKVICCGFIMGHHSDEYDEINFILVDKKFRGFGGGEKMMLTLLKFYDFCDIGNVSINYYGEESCKKYFYKFGFFQEKKFALICAALHDNIPELNQNKMYYITKYACAKMGMPHVTDRETLTKIMSTNFP